MPYPRRSARAGPLYDAGANTSPDYEDFFRFNFPIVDPRPRDVPRPPLDAIQATRLILMRLRVTKVEPAGAGDNPDYPVTYFAGFSRALDGAWDDNAQSDIRGTVRVTPEGEVQWTSYSVFNGEERWKSEGVQVGGIRSARGVVGTWFDKYCFPPPVPRCLFFHRVCVLLIRVFFSQRLQPPGPLRADGVLEDLGPSAHGRRAAGAAGGSLPA